MKPLVITSQQENPKFIFTGRTRVRMGGAQVHRHAV